MNKTQEEIICSVCKNTGRYLDEDDIYTYCDCKHGDEAFANTHKHCCNFGAY